ncbi:MAG: xanthine dehydrogenase family protein molybdopterin-binding subunit, partial [Proteobacteria bacterium]|nr:xanthine dehydrogenase family protein molybdopterin-binding subunit [Pseudomonadota bacterium]
MAAGKAFGHLSQDFPGGAVAGVPGDLQGFLPGLEITQQPGRVIVEDGFLRDLALALGKIAGGGPLAQQLNIAGEKRLAADDQFDAVVSRRVVRPGDHQSGIDAQGPFGVIQHRRRPQSDAGDIHPGGQEPLDQGRLQIRRRQPAVIADGGALAAPVAQNRPEGAADGAGGIPCGFAPAGVTTIEPPRPALVQGKVCFVGDLVAVVIAETLNQAKDAAERIEVDYEPLPAVVRVEDAAKPGAPQVHDEAENNVCFDWELGDKAGTDEAFAKAHHVTKLDLVNNRKIPNAIEPRAAIGEYDAGNDSHTLYTTSQNPHLTRLLMGAFVLHIPEHKLRVVSPDVGGGFGSKIPHTPEEAIVTWAAKKVGRPVKWTAERSESFLSDAHGRDHATHAELALDENGKFLGLRVDTTVNMG